MSAPPIRVAPWEDFVLRLIAVYKLLHAVFFTAVGFGLFKLKHGHHTVVEVIHDYIVIPYHLDPENRWVDWMLDKAGMLSPHLAFFGWAAFFYAALFAAEGIGLYLRKHWAEYLVVIVTGSLLPLELYELYIKLAWWKFGVVAGNLLIVCYLIHRIILDTRFKARRLEEESRKGDATSVSSDPMITKIPQ